MVFIALFDIYSREPDFWAENQIFKNFSKSLKTCLVDVFWEFHGIFSIIRHLSREPVFSAKNRSVSSIFSIVRHLVPEPDIWDENRIFKKFLKSLKTCLVRVFLVSRSPVWHLSREPDVWAENRIFTNFFKSLKTCLVWCFLSASRHFSIVRNLIREPDFSAENRIYKNFSKRLKTCLAGVFWVFHGILALFDIWAENRIFQPRMGFSKIS